MQERKDDRGGGSVGDPVHDVAVAVQRRNHLGELDQGSERRKADQQLEWAGARESEESECTERQKRGDVLYLVVGLAGQLRRQRIDGGKERQDDRNPEDRAENRQGPFLAHGSAVAAPPLDGEGLGWGYVLAREAAMFTPSQPSPIKGEGESNNS